MRVGFFRHLSLKVPKGQITSGQTEHTTGKEWGKLRREVRAEDTRSRIH